MCKAAQSLSVVTIVFPDTGESGGSTEYQTLNFTIGFTYQQSWNIRTLSTSHSTGGSDLTGLVYTPDLSPGNPCIAESAQYIPANVTRQRTLPQAEYQLIAIAPWTSARCARAYLDAASQDPVTGLFFFKPPGQVNDIPEADDGSWHIAGSAEWMNHAPCPVYAIPSANGERLLRASSQYSGNLTDVPNGQRLETIYQKSDYARLFAVVRLAGGSSLPSLWIFLLVVLAVLLAIIGFTSVVMHWLQRRRRNSLRRRVANGEVDLEALGIKRLTVPQEVLDKMPLYTYGSGAPVSPEAARSNSTAVTTESPSPASDKLDSSPSTRPTSPIPPVAAPKRSRPKNPRAPASYNPTPLQQPTCAICLDDFVPPSTSPEPTPGTTVRELPCHHIFHPECVDSFLKDSSSLCPMCKKTALPTGYCPRAITNAMVRRERMVRRGRAGAEEAGGAEWTHDRLATRMRTLRTRSVAPQPSTNPAETVVQPESTPRRREWARQRAVEMLGNHTAPVDPDAEDAAHTPRWRKALRSMFPAR